MISYQQKKYGEKMPTITIGGKEYKLPTVPGTAGQYLVIAADGKSLEWKS